MLSESEQLQTLRRQYFALYPLHRLQLPKSDLLAKNQLFLKEHVLEDPKLGRYQPEAGYRKTFWRRVVTALEEGVENLLEHDDEAVSSHCKLEWPRLMKAGSGRGILRAHGGPNGLLSYNFSVNVNTIQVTSRVCPS